MSGLARDAIRDPGGRPSPKTHRSAVRPPGGLGREALTTAQRPQGADGFSRAAASSFLCVPGNRTSSAKRFKNTSDGGGGPRAVLRLTTVLRLDHRSSCVTSLTAAQTPMGAREAVVGPTSLRRAALKSPPGQLRDGRDRAAGDSGGAARLAIPAAPADAGLWPLRGPETTS